MLFLIIVQLSNGYLSVTADQDGLPIYVEDDYIGNTPIIRYPLKPDEYNVGFFPQDSIETASWRLKHGGLSDLWRIVKYGEGIVKVRIAPDSLTTVELNYKRVMSAPGKAKLKMFVGLGSIFLLGVLTTLTVQALF